MEKTIKDRNFDDLAHKFRKKVYGKIKGQIRLAVLENDLKEFFPLLYRNPAIEPINILDAGCGHAPFSLELARFGHRVTLCDHSKGMLDIARESFDPPAAPEKVYPCAIQKLPETLFEQFDLVLCHAVLEWTMDPREMIGSLIQFLKKDGILSLTFYNLNGTIYKNLLRTNYKKILKKAYAGWPGSLTPTRPLLPEDVLKWLGCHPVKILCHSGMRVFHDYVLNLEDQKKAPDTVIALELEFSRVMPFRDLGRYQHILVKNSV